MTRRTIAIMQPTYLPWIGYFDLIDQSDCFVFLDSVQFAKRSWQQRNRIKSYDGELLLTVPVVTKGRRIQSICEAEIDQTATFNHDHIKSIEHSYSKAAFFGKYFEGLKSLLSKRYRYLSHLNIDIISWLSKAIGIEREMTRSSLLGCQGRKVDLLVAICKTVGVERYLSPIGSREYIEQNNIFAENGIELVYHNYQHPRYRQLHGEFLPYLSAIDLLLNEGEQSLSIIRSGRNNV